MFSFPEKLEALLRDYAARYEAEFAQPALDQIVELERELADQFAAEVELPTSKAQLEEFSANLRYLHLARLYFEDRIRCVKANPTEGF